MFVYEKKLQYPVKIANCNPNLASIVISQYGGPYANRLLKKLYRGAVCEGESVGGFVVGAGFDDGIGGVEFFGNGGIGGS